MKQNLNNGVQFVDTLTLRIAYDDKRENVDLFEIEKQIRPIREKMRSSHCNNLYVEVYKPKNLSSEVFCSMIGRDLAIYGFSDVRINSADSYRQRNGLTRAILSEMFDSVEYLDGVLPVGRSHKKKSVENA